MMLKLFLAALLASGCVCLAQSGEELRLAVIVTRHGVRAPTWTQERLNEYSAAPWPKWDVPPAHLTPHGRALMKIMGGFYRGYLQQRGLPGLEDCPTERKIHIRADVDQRTIETGRALAEGLMPGCEIPVRLLEGKDSDPVFDPIEAGEVMPDAKLGLAAVTGRIGPKLEAIVSANRAAFDALDYVLKGSGSAAKSLLDEPVTLDAAKSNVSMAGSMRTASTLSENLLLEYTNGMRGDQLGWGRLDKQKLVQIMALHTTYADLLRRTPYLARLRGGRLLEQVLLALQQAAGGKRLDGALTPAQSSLVVFSGHDTNISNLSGLLDLSWTISDYQRDDVPPGGALLFTLWRSRQTGQHSVRIQFVTQTLDQMRDMTALSNDRRPEIADLFLSGCSTSAPGYPCPLNSFIETARRAIAGP